MKLEEISATTHKSNIGAHHEPVKFKWHFYIEFSEHPV
jgi:hypothetical protein